MTQPTIDKDAVSKDTQITTPQVMAAGAAVAAVAAAAATGMLNSTTSGAAAAAGTTSATGTTSTTGAANATGNAFSQLWNGSNTTAPVSSSPSTTNKPAPVMPEAEAVRFLMQASTGFTPQDIKSVQSMGYAQWIDEQMDMRAGPGNEVAYFYWANCARRYGGNPYGPGSGESFTTKFVDDFGDLSRALWWRLLSPPDTLRQRVALALSEICVVSTTGLKDVKCYWPFLASAQYFDLLADNAFGNYRNLLRRLPFNPAMGTYLNVAGSQKVKPKSPAVPDENFARELMQLFTIGTVMLNPDGTEQRVNGQPVPTYGLEDVQQLARIFTGLEYPANVHKQEHNDKTFRMPPWLGTGLTLNAANHDTGACTFLGQTVASSTNARDRMMQAIDILFAHSNVAPFISKQLIQRLVTSNPSPAYVARVASVFQNDGSGVRGNLAAVVKAVLLDPEARLSIGTIQTMPTYGKVREPLLRFTHWARMFNAKSTSGYWMSNGQMGIGPFTMWAPSVFNFFRPDYVPDYAPLANKQLVAPELQIADAQSVANYLNKMYVHINAMSCGDMTVSYEALGADAPKGLDSLADDATALVKKLSLWLTAGEFTPWAGPTIEALNQMPKGTPEARLNRVKVAMFMTVASPDFIVQK
jgi:uncharacterized protein (DUF1800 family)